MAADTRHLLAGMILSLVITVSVSVGLRMIKTQAVEASPSLFAVACVY